MNTDDLIGILRAQLQEIENVKTQLTETQEELRATIAALQMAEVEA